MPRVVPQSVYVPYWYGVLANQPNGIASEDADHRYLELQFQAFCPAGVATRVFTVPIPTIPGLARRVLVELYGTSVAFGTPGVKDQYSVARLGITTGGAYTITGLGRVVQTNSGTDPNPTIDLNAQFINNAWYLRLNVTTSVDSFYQGQLVLNGIQ